MNYALVAGEVLLGLLGTIVLLVLAFKLLGRLLLLGAWVISAVSRSRCYARNMDVQCARYDGHPGTHVTPWKELERSGGKHRFRSHFTNDQSAACYASWGEWDDD